MDVDFSVAQPVAEPAQPVMPSFTMQVVQPTIQITEEDVSAALAQQQRQALADKELNKDSSSSSDEEDGTPISPNR